MGDTPLPQELEGVYKHMHTASMQQHSHAGRDKEKGDTCSAGSSRKGLDSLNRNSKDGEAQNRKSTDRGQGPSSRDSRDGYAQSKSSRDGELQSRSSRDDGQIGNSPSRTSVNESSANPVLDMYSTDVTFRPPGRQMHPSQQFYNQQFQSQQLNNQLLKSQQMNSQQLNNQQFQNQQMQNHYPQRMQLRPHQSQMHSNQSQNQSQMYGTLQPRPSIQRRRDDSDNASIMSSSYNSSLQRMQPRPQPDDSDNVSIMSSSVNKYPQRMQPRPLLSHQVYNHQRQPPPNQLYSHRQSPSNQMHNLNLNQQYGSPRPNLPRDDSDNISLTSNATNNTAAVNEALLHHQDLELYRQTVKKSNDVKVQLDFARQLIQVAEEMRRNPRGVDPKRIKKNRDVLHAEAVRWIKKSSTGSLLGKPGYDEALFMLADCYGNGTLGLAIDHDKAFSLYAQAAKQGHLASIYRSGVCYEVGADPTRAMQFYMKSAAMGDNAAMYKLGTILLNGTLGQTKNPRDGVNWLKRAASHEDNTTPHALHELAMLYQSTDSEDPLYSQELFMKSAHLGYAPSQFQLGLAYEYGYLGLPIDPRRSIAWYSKSATQGEPEAELALSGWYLTGFNQVLAKNDHEAYLWAKKAADKGLAKAEYALGYFLENGIGIPHNFEESRRWYMRSSGQGNKLAIRRINEINAGIDSDMTNPADWRAEKEARGGECVLM